MALNDIYDYFRNYDRESFSIFACQGNEPTESNVAAFEATIGFRLPDEFREFTMSPLGGLYMEVKEELWPRPKLYDVGPFWSFLYGLNVFGIAADIPEMLDIRVQTSAMATEGFTGLVPFLQRIGDANKYCFRPSGEIVYWDHEVPDECSAIDETFSELLLREIHELETRKDQKLRGEDKQKPTGEIRPEFQKSYANNKPCPYCGQPLRSNAAKQCFACGRNWH
ncbi:MAG TPA: SMI1/KNR4 family protein [Pirellulaceae bacterium]|nr:SMI1/KNR4 family protein [Pirellulaceae bacterium]